MSSLLSGAPALLLLEACLLTVFFHDGRAPLWASLPAALFLLCAQMLIAESRWDRRKISFSIGLLALSALLSSWLCVQLEREPVLPGSLNGNFIVAERRPWGNGELLRLKDDDGNGWIMPLRPSLKEDVREGDRIALNARVLPLKRETERSSFEPYRYWRACGVKGELRSAGKWRYLGKSFSIHAFRQSLRERIARLPAGSAALTGAVLLGDKEANLREDHRRWGTSHILAVSGWHVGLVLALSCFLFGAKRRGILAGSVLLWSYCLLSGASMSAVRATVMLQAYMTGLLFGRGGSLMNSLSLAGVLMLLWNPWAAFDAGWQLSVLAALTLAGLGSLGDVCAVCLSSPVMWFMTSPIIAPVTGGLCLSSLPINVIAAAFFTFILGFVLLASLPTLLGFDGFYFSLPAELLLKAWGLIADQWVEWLPRALPVNSFPAWLCAGVLFLLVARSAKLSWLRSVLLCMTGCFIMLLL